MGTRTLSVEVPDELVALLGTPEAAAVRAREALVLDLLRRAKVSQDKAAELLGVSRWDLLELMVEHRVESGPETGEEMAREIEDMRRWAASQGPRAGGQ
jgi:predicted HTH domain antitoxin